MLIAATTLLVLLAAGCPGGSGAEDDGRTAMPPQIAGGQAESGTPLADSPPGTPRGPASDEPVHDTPPGVEGDPPPADELPASGYTPRMVRLDNHMVQAGPHENSVPAVLDVAIYDEMKGLYDDPAALDNLVEEGAVLFIHNGTEVALLEREDAPTGFALIEYMDKRWYVKDAFVVDMDYEPALPGGDEESVHDPV
jgi:hypothetical protein